MCPLFGPGVRSGAEALELIVKTGGQQPLAWAAAERTVALGMAAVEHRLGREALGQPRPRVRTRTELAARLGVPDFAPTAHVESNLDVALQVPMTRALVPAEDLGAGQIDHWLARIANARRVPQSRLELVGIFPNLPLGEGAGVKLDAARGEAHVMLVPGRVLLTTIAVARRKDTGESVVAKLEA